jgi:hypothetical protein
VGPSGRAAVADCRDGPPAASGARRPALRRLCALALAASSTLAPVAMAQVGLARERAEYAAWLTTSPISPRAAVALQPVGPGLRLGPAEADVPLDGIGPHRLVARAGAIRLEHDAVSQPVPRGRPVRLGRYTLRVDGPQGREVLTVFRPRPGAAPPSYYGPSPDFVFIGRIDPPARPGTVRVLGLDGIEVEAGEAGSVLVPTPGGRTRLRVLRLPSAGNEESELEIFFRDETSGHGTYPAGRFVALTPAEAGQYRLDFNRARNPFCAYSSAYACPAPWRGNTLPMAVTAGERYVPGHPPEASINTAP